MTNATPGPVEVTQADREAAWPFYRAAVDYPATHEFKANWMLGHLDNAAIVQAFARHRIEAAPPVQSELVEALRSAIAAIEDGTGLDDAICCGGHDCGCRAATHRQLLLHDLRAALSQYEDKETDNG